MSREYKKYGIRPARKPGTNPCLSGTVLVIDEHGTRGYCYIRFDEPLVTAVGKKLPQGVSTHNPAYLVLRYDWRRKAWVVSARYVEESVGYVLWETAEKPLWLKNFFSGVDHVKNNQNVASTESASTGTETGTSGAETAHSSAEGGGG